MEEQASAGAQTSERAVREVAESDDMSRWALIWRVLVFQFKLMIDGFRDLVLSPLSLIAVALGILFTPQNPGYFFARLINWGRQTEKWINLFDQYDKAHDDGSVDDYISQVETVIRRDHARGGVSAATQRTVDRLIDKLRAGTTRSE